MKWTEKRRKAYEIDLSIITESTMAPKLKLTICGYSTTMNMTREFIEDIRWQTTLKTKEIIDKMIDDEIEKHPEFLRNIRRLKIKKLNEQNNYNK